jgi:hypothetical protein
MSVQCFGISHPSLDSGRVANELKMISSPADARTYGVFARTFGMDAAVFSTTTVLTEVSPSIFVTLTVKL